MNSTLIPDSMVDRLANYLANHGGSDIDPRPFREQAKRLLRAALGTSPEFDLPDESTYSLAANPEIKGADGNWYEVPEPVLERYRSVVGIAGANLSEFQDNHLTDAQLHRLARRLYSFYSMVDEKSQKTIREGLQRAIIEAAQSDDET